MVISFYIIFVFLFKSEFVRNATEFSNGIKIMTCFSQLGIIEGKTITLSTAFAGDAFIISTAGCVVHSCTLHMLAIACVATLPVVAKLGHSVFTFVAVCFAKTIMAYTCPHAVTFIRITCFTKTLIQSICSYSIGIIKSSCIFNNVAAVAGSINSSVEIPVSAFLNRIFNDFFMY